MKMKILAGVAIVVLTLWTLVAFIALTGGRF